ncbi:MAG: hypothetical protein IMZ61_13520 [Planctomycetes bacterium]|nr:hypothetical protein [Planctomycetota bacterium]
MIIFAACIGYHLDQFDEEVDIIKHDPDPIAIEIFKNQELYDPILLLVLAKTGSYLIIDDDEKVPKIIEGYASAGFRYLTRVLEDQTEHNYRQFLIEQISEDKKE